MRTTAKRKLQKGKANVLKDVLADGQFRQQWII